MSPERPWDWPGWPIAWLSGEKLRGVLGTARLHVLKVFDGIPTFPPLLPTLPGHVERVCSARRDLCEVVRWRDGQVIEDWGFAFDQYTYDEFWS